MNTTGKTAATNGWQSSGQRMIIAIIAFHDKKPKRQMAMASKRES